MLFCLYIDNLLAKLSNCGAGCYIGSDFVGVLAYTDDIVLLAPTLSALHKMLHMCELYASAYDIKFNVDKSRCMIVPPRGRRSFLTTILMNVFFYLDGLCMEKYSHPGHIITNRLDDSKDIYSRLCNLIGKINSILCYF